MHSTIRAFAPLAVAGLIAAFAHPAAAQDSHLGPVVTPKPMAPKSEVPPPALPGAALGKDRVVPADKSVSDLPPNEALFDAINRGDIASARDSLSRGADPNAINVLGLSAVEQSIDLGRNDITFLLISLRGGSPSGPPPAPDGKAKPPTKIATPRPAPPPPAPKKVAPALSATASAVPPPTAPYKAVATGGGNPQPQAGFLGFGG